MAAAKGLTGYLGKGSGPGNPFQALCAIDKIKLIYLNIERSQH